MRNFPVALLAWALAATCLPAATAEGTITEMDKDGIIMFNTIRGNMLRMRFSDELKKGLPPRVRFPNWGLRVKDIGVGDTICVDYGHEGTAIVIRQMQMIKPANYLTTGIEPGG